MVIEGIEERKREKSRGTGGREGKISGDIYLEQDPAAGGLRCMKESWIDIR